MTNHLKYGVEFHDQSKNGTVVSGDKWAVVYTPSEGFTILVPDLPDNADVPDAVLALIGCLARLYRDGKFRKEILDWTNEDIDKAVGKDNFH